MVSQICIREIKLFKVVAAEVSGYLGQTQVLRNELQHGSNRRADTWFVGCESEVSSHFLYANVR